MLLEEYKFSDREDKVRRFEDKYLYGYELYRADVTGNELISLCVGSYGFPTKEATEISAQVRATSISLELNKTLDVDIYAKIFELDMCRNPLPDKTYLITVKEGSIKYKNR